MGLKGMIEFLNFWHFADECYQSVMLMNCNWWREISQKVNMCIMLLLLILSYYTTMAKYESRGQWWICATTKIGQDHLDYPIWFLERAEMNMFYFIWLVQNSNFHGGKNKEHIPHTFFFSSQKKNKHCIWTCKLGLSMSMWDSRRIHITSNQIQLSLLSSNQSAEWKQALTHWKLSIFITLIDILD